ncbi:MAG: Re/Si-specific NAD(P)(+) transhydrogenase subunit alpha [Deltaproteobacteria bacterium]|nr:Re/Si-specific NAD(P)(+) transhydrogenase subunit alpha [Deltaproteobacteria bacterium]
MKLAIVKETRPEERRVAVAPATAARLIKAGWEVIVERSAGEAASFPDRDYEAAGAVVVDTPTAWGSADVVVKVRAPEVRADGTDEATLLREGTTLISFVFPAQNPELVARLAARKINLLAMDCIPRISRAQKVDALSSMANIAGYRAVVEAANKFGSFFTGQFTAAGKVPPAKVLIIGAGVAGLAAIAAAKSLGAIVRAFDVRPSVAEQITSLGGEFLTVTVAESGEGQGGYAKEMSKEFIDAEMALFRAQAKDVNIVITTALIPGKPAPKLWLTDMVESMKPGSVIVDLAAEAGGNCECTRAGEAVVHKGVTILGYTDMPSRMANVASDLYGTNIWHLLDEMGGAAKFAFDHSNEIVRGALVLEGGEKRWPPPKPEPKPDAKGDAKPDAKAAAAPKPVEAPKPAPAAAPAPKKSHGHGGAPAKPMNGQILVAALIAFVGAFLGLRYGVSAKDMSPDTNDLLQRLTVFVLAVFVGWQVVWNVTPALHTPLMSVTNAISGIIVVGGLLGGSGSLDTAAIVGIAAILFATINIVGGFWVTRRMLAMFRK